jgi:hypothetical protein
VAKLIDDLRVGAPSVKQQAAIALGKMERKERLAAVPALIGALDDPQSGIQ